MFYKCVVKEGNNLFFGNYAKPGKGINKRDPNEPKFKIFLDVFPRKLWSLFKLNVLYILVSVPFAVITMIVSGVISSHVLNDIYVTTLSVTDVGVYDILIRLAVSFIFMVFAGLGPTTAGFIYIIREYACERHCWLFSDFFGQLKTNFKHSILLWFVDLAVMYLFTIAYDFYGKSGNAIFQYIILLVVLIYIMMHFYIYQIMITFDLPFKNILKNSFLLTMGKAHINLLILVCNVIVYVIVPISLIMSNASSLITMLILLAEVLFLPSLTNFITSFYVISELEKYINDNEQKGEHGL